MSLAQASVAVLRTCLVQAVRSAGALMSRLLQRTEYSLEQALFTDLPAAQRDVLRAALHNLQQHRSYLIGSYPQNLLEALVLSARQPFSFTAQSLHSEDWALMPLPQVAEFANRQLMAEHKLLQVVAPQVELALADLDALMCGAQGLDVVSPGCNPLRPENYVRALDQVLTAVQPATEVAQCWRDWMGQHLGGLLVSEYAGAASLLRKHSVLPARYGDEPSDTAQTAALLALRVLQEMAGDVRWMGERHVGPPPSLVDSVFSGEVPVRAQTAASGLEPDWASYSSSILHSCSGLLSAGVTGRQMLEPSQAPRALVSARTVQRMVVHMAADARLMPAVQRVLQQLEPALIRLVEYDTAFLQDSQHPARQLLDELTARSLWFGHESAPGFDHFVAVAEAVASRLKASAAINAQVFAWALQFVREHWTSEGALQTSSYLGPISHQDSRHDSSTHGLMSSALGLLERPSAREFIQSRPDAQSIARTIRNLPSAQGVPDDILDFVTGPWAEVISQAQRSSTASSQRDPGGYLALVPTLLWSVSSRAAENTAKLVELAPRLQRRLERGLRSVGRSDVEIAALVARITELHQSILDRASFGVSSGASYVALPESGVPSAQASFAQISPAREVLTSETAIAPQVAADWMTASAGESSVSEPVPDQASGAHSGAQLEGAAGPAQSLAGHTECLAPEESCSSAHSSTSSSMGTSAQWALGTWVELRSERQQLRTQLTWVSPQQTLFLFTAEDGSTQSMTRRMRDKLLAKGQLTRIEMQA